MSTEVGQSPLRDGTPLCGQVMLAGSAFWIWTFQSLWHHGDLLYFLVWRDLKVRYKQTAIGVGWAVIQPLITMLLFTAVFSRLAKIPSDGVPYPIFAFAALLPWTVLFAGGRAQWQQPRQQRTPGDEGLFPAARHSDLRGAVAPGRFRRRVRAAPGPDGLVSDRPDLGTGLRFPLFLLLCLATAPRRVAAGCRRCASSIATSASSFRSSSRSGCIASPVAYPVSMVPAQWRLLYSLNPMAGVIEGFRWALLGTDSPDFGVMAVSAVVVLVCCSTGARLFQAHRADVC